MGGTIPPARLTLHALVTGADGATLESIQNGRVIASEPATGRPNTREVIGAPGDWYSLIVRDAGDPVVRHRCSRV